MDRYDIIISGCGPVGATLAVLLGQHGVRTLVLEKYAEPYDKPRAIVLDWEVMRVFQFCGITDELAPSTAPHTGTDFVGMDGQIIKQFDPLPPPYPLGWPATLMFIQPDLERILRDKITSMDTVDLETGTRFDTFVQDADGVTVTYTDLADSQASTVKGAYLIGCDGANSAVRDACSIDLIDYQFDEWWIVVDAWQQRDTDLPAKTTQYCWPSRPATYVVGPQNLRRWEIKLMPGERPEDFEDSAKLREVMSNYVDVDAFDIWRSACYRFNARVGAKWRKDRVFLAGDAMHQMPPFLGQGLCAGIRDVANLSWKLIHAIKHGYNDALLDTYEAERLPHVGKIIEHAKEFGLIIGELDEAKARARDKVLRAQLLSGKMGTSRQGFIPDLTSGILDKNDPLAGTLMVQPKLPDGTLLDDRAPMEFIYLALDDTAQTWADACASDLSRLGVIRITITEELGDTLHTWGLTHGLRAVLIRPDRYVWGGVTDADDLHQKLITLQKQLDG